MLSLKMAYTTASCYHTSCDVTCVTSHHLCYSRSSRAWMQAEDVNATRQQQF